MKYTLSNQPEIIISIDQMSLHRNVPIVISYAYEYTLFFLLMKGSKKSVEIDTFATPYTHIKHTFWPPPVWKFPYFCNPSLNIVINIFSAYENMFSYK